MADLTDDPDVPATLVARDRFSGVARLRRGVPPAGKRFGLRRRVCPQHPDPLLFDPLTGPAVRVNGLWVADWWEVEDETVSRVHAVLEWHGERLTVRRVLDPRRTRNPIRFDGRERDEFDLLPGESFDTGRTHFILLPGDHTLRDGPDTDDVLLAGLPGEEG